MYDRFKWSSASFRRNRLTKEYEPLQPFFLTAFAERARCQTFIDVGANVGAYSFFATLVPTISRVVAFEADPVTFNEFRENIRLNRLEDRIQVWPTAVSDAVGTLTFGSMGHLSGASGVVDTSIHDVAKFRDRYSVKSTTLDETFGADAPGPLALKIDVEGHESAVLDGAKSTLRANQAIIQIECYDEQGAKTRRRLNDLGFEQVTAIGPDHYFTNIASLCDASETAAIYENAARAMIDYYHRDKPVTIEGGDFTLEIVGKSAALARQLKRLVGR